MNWYYVLDGDQKGPLDQAEFDQLAQTGVIRNETLVWREGMAEWLSYGQVTGRPLSVTGTASQPEVVCSECGRIFGMDQTIKLGSGYVCADCKVVALQKLREGVSNSDSERIRQEHIKHEASVKSIGFLYFMAATGLLFGGGAIVLTRSNEGAIMGFVGLAFAAAFIWVGIGLRGLKSWARIPTGILAGFGLLGFPLGTLINAYILYLIFCKKGATVFSEDYKRVIQETPNIKYKTSIVVWIFVGLVIFLIVMAVLGFILGGRR